MRIGIDIRSLQNDSKLRGIGSYTRSLIKSLLSIDRENQYVFFAHINESLPGFLDDKLFREVKIARITYRRKRFVWLSGQVFLPFATRKERLDIFHSPEYIVPVFSNSKKIITVHDFINNDYSIYKKRSGLIRRMYFYLKDKTLNYADKIIAVSEYTKKKIMELVRIKEDKIKVIYEAADEIFRPCNDNELFSKIKNKYNIDKEFLLYVGAVDYHKNIDGLIRAFGQIKTKDIGLILVGVNHDKKYLEFINNLIEGFGLKNRVYILGYVPQEELFGFYNLAIAVVSISVYEGFGLPIIEAMACAKPVIVSKHTSMEEIVGDCGILVDPYNIDEITSAINSLLSDEELRSHFSKKGLARSKEFTWEKTARQTLALYEDLIR